MADAAPDGTDRRPPAPGTGDVGLASADAAGVRSRVLASWEAFLAVAATVELDADSRVPGWSGRDVCVHLGTWDDARPLERILASARAGGVGHPPDADADNAAVIAAHRNAGRDAVLAALRRARDGVAAFFDSPACAELGLAPTVSVLGPLPVLTLVHAGCYELAVHALDLVPCGGGPVPLQLRQAGLGALIDVTAALAVRQGVTATVAAQTPDGGWRFSATGAGWTTVELPPGPVVGCAVLGTAADVLDVSAGRVSAPSLIGAKRLRVQDMRAFLALAPLVESVPGLPGGAPLRAAARTLGAAAGVVARLPGAGLFRRR